MKIWLAPIVLTLIALIMGACTTGGGLKGDRADTSEAVVTEKDRSATQGIEARGTPEGSQYGDERGAGYQGDPLEDPNSLLSTRVVYFAYDSSEVEDEYRDVIAAHALYLADHPEVTVTLEGHADERGSREYNIGLGERRAQSLGQFLVLQGVSENQVQTISYGEERPVALGHEEASWRQNRRVELVY